jgi:myo-inositol-1(or 4)-monophosphatase
MTSGLKTTLLEEAVKAAREAGRYLRDNIEAEREITYKSSLDLVTNFDRGAQSLIFDRLSRAFPEHGFLGEEDLRRTGRSDFRWVIDPLDGTTNYAHGFPVFSVSIALEERGDVRLGVVFDPMRNELFQAVAGEGAFLNGRRIRVSAVEDLERSLLATGFPYDVRNSSSNNIGHFNRFLVRAQAIRRCGSAAIDLCYVACGRFDGFWELKLKPWDTAAGVLMIREAGGIVTDFSGGEYRLGDLETLASNGRIHAEMKKILDVPDRETAP